MRQIGTIERERDARSFADYLLTRGITTRIDPTADGWAVWVHREEQVPAAREELSAFRADPADPRYAESARRAEALRKQADRDDRRHARNSIDMRGRIESPWALTGIVTRLVFIACVAVFVADWLGLTIAGRPLYDWLRFTTWGLLDGRPVSAGLAPIRSGQVWRIVTPIFIHYGLIHIFFNMSMFLRIGRLIEARRGHLGLVVLILFTAVVSNFAQYAFPDAFTVPGARTPGNAFGGMSGVLYGLFGYIWVRSKRHDSPDLFLPPDTVAILLIWLVVCAFNLVGPTANTAHVAGLVAGATAAFIEAEYDRARR